jgi:hypothetical protein
MKYMDPPIRGLRLTLEPRDGGHLFQWRRAGVVVGEGWAAGGVEGARSAAHRAREAIDAAVVALGGAPTEVSDE